MQYELDFSSPALAPVQAIHDKLSDELEGGFALTLSAREKAVNLCAALNSYYDANAAREVLITQLFDALDAGLRAFDDEEDSVQEEHEETIDQMRAAIDAWQNQLPRLTKPELALHLYDCTEVHPVRDYEEGGQRFTEQCDRAEAQYWSVYLHLSSGGAECIADYATETEADAFAEIMTDRIQDATAEHDAIERRDRDERGTR